jgi:hypothetical protein
MVRLKPGLSHIAPDVKSDTGFLGTVGSKNLDVSLRQSGRVSKMGDARLEFIAVALSATSNLKDRDNVLNQVSASMMAMLSL